MSEHISTALLLAFLIGIAVGVFGSEAWRKIRLMLKAWRFRHKVLSVYTPPVKKEK